MSIRGEIVVECDTQGCYAELTLPPWALTGGITAAMDGEGWKFTPSGRDICPQCVEDTYCPVCWERPRTKDEHGRLYRRCDACEDGDTDPDIAVPFAANH